VVLVIIGFWIGNNPQWALFGLLSKLMSMAVGVWFAVIGCLFTFNPCRVRLIARHIGNEQTLGIVYHAWAQDS
jgi:hypothetical protein